MHREFNITLGSTSAISIWDAIVAAGYCDSLGNTLISSAKNDAITPDRVQQLNIIGTTVGSTATVLDLYQTSGGTPVSTTVAFNRSSNRNTICLKDHQLKGSTNDVFAISTESI